MGALESREKLGQLVAIYGYNSNDFSWIDVNSRSVYHTTGIIANYNDKKYVITMREKIISCKHIVMYHSYFHTCEPVMRNDLYVIFHSIEYNIVILASVGSEQFDLSMSENISGNYDPIAICPSHDMLNNLFVVPTKRSHYYTVKMGMDLESSIINFCVDIFDVKFVSSFIHDESYVPNNLMYKFTLKNNNSNKTKLVGICGSVIFNKKNQLIGLITKCKNKMFYVLPRFALIKIFNDFIQYYDIPNEYTGLINLPFDYYITKNKKVKFYSTSIIYSNSFVNKINKNDEIVTICDSNIVVNNNEVYIYDNVYKENVPLDIFIKLHYNKMSPIKLQIRRRNKIIDIDFYGISDTNPLVLTNRSYFYPSNFIPHININGIIMIQLTHEFLDISICNKIYIKNFLVDKYIEGTGNDTIFNMVLIIDCLNDDFVNKYNLPKIEPKKEQTIICPIVTKFNGENIFSLSELDAIIQKNESDNPIKLGIMTSDDDYREIKL